VNIVKSVIFFLLIVALVLFSVQNHQLITIRFLEWSFKISKALFVVFAIVLGMGMGWLARTAKKG
jgi:uncharacterized integral membrane protein